MQLREYFAQLREWEEKYGKPRKRRVDLRRVSTKCAKCRKVRKRMSRHHIGNDFLWASLHPDEFAPRYVEFRAEDVALLCNGCHGRIHKLYDKVLYSFWLDWAVERTDDLSYKPPIEECREYQQRCIEVYEKWLKQKGR